MEGDKKKGCGLYAVAIAVGAVIAAVAWLLLFAMKSYHGESRWIFIPESATVNSLKDSLESRLGTVGTNVYMVWKLAGGDLSVAHGAYLVKDGDDAFSIGRRIGQGRQTPIRVTINNVRTIRQLAQKIAAKMEFSDDDFIEACNLVLPGAGFEKPEYPAAFLPDTYEFYWTSSADVVVGRMLEYRNRFWNDARRSKAVALGLTPVKVAILASIVEEETNAVDERSIVARLYINRLSKGMMLQADPTVKFAVGDMSIRRITARHLAIESPYNTYRYGGLPPGPIRIVEKSTIDAVLNAPDHNYIYMCAKEDFSGRHNFASDYNTHQRNANRYRSELNRRNIR